MFVKNIDDIKENDINNIIKELDDLQNLDITISKEKIQTLYTIIYYNGIYWSNNSQSGFFIKIWNIFNNNKIQKNTKEDINNRYKKDIQEQNKHKKKAKIIGEKISKNNEIFHLWTFPYLIEIIGTILCLYWFSSN